MSRLAPGITFGMIVLNGMPFLPYNLRALYPFAHQIIVVEGAAPGASAIATADGHSRDGTREELARFAREDDPDGKVVVVVAEDEGHPNGFWPGEKDEQSRAYASRATGDYLWQVDVDEFYMPGDLALVADRLGRLPEVTAATFPTITFWGSPSVCVDSWYLRRGAADYHRLFRWGEDCTYRTHRPPTVVDANGRDMRAGLWIGPEDMRRRGIAMHHYSLLFPRQVREKVEYYVNWGLYEDPFADARRWLADSYLTLRRPYRVHNVYEYPGWLTRWNGPHPPEVLRMMDDIEAGRVAEETREMWDAERLLRSSAYALGSTALRLAEPLAESTERLRAAAGRVVRQVVGRPGAAR
jgi:hypothetical protein